MKRTNRIYPDEFKRQALELLATGGYSMAEVERQLGITKGLLKDWRRKAETAGEAPLQKRSPQSAAETQERLRQLERENARLKLEAEILKKAVAIFSNPRA
jgi:transposase